MRTRPILPLVFLALLVSAPTAGATVLGQGTELGGHAATVLRMGYDLTVTTLSFEPGTGAPTFNDSIIVDLEANDGVSAYQWTLLSLAPSSNVTVSGNPSVNGSFRIVGLDSISYMVTGVFGTMAFSIMGPNANFTVPAGNQTIIITPTGITAPGTEVDLSVVWSAGTQAFGATVVVTNSTGEGALNATVVFTLMQPSGTVFDSGIMSYSGVPGVYRRTVADASPVQGPWSAIANVGNFSDGAALTVEAVQTTPFFSTGIVMVMPYLALIIAWLVISPRLTAWFTQAVLALVMLVAALTVFMSKTTMDGVNPLLAPMVAIIMLALALLQLVLMIGGSKKPSANGL